MIVSLQDPSCHHDIYKTDYSIVRYSFHNSILDRHNGMVDRYNEILDRYNRIVYRYIEILDRYN